MLLFASWLFITSGKGPYFRNFSSSLACVWDSTHGFTFDIQMSALGVFLYAMLSCVEVAYFTVCLRAGCLHWIIGNFCIFLIFCVYPWYCHGYIIHWLHFCLTMCCITFCLIIMLGSLIVRILNQNCLIKCCVKFYHNLCLMIFVLEALAVSNFVWCIVKLECTLWRTFYWIWTWVLFCSITEPSALCRQPSNRPTAPPATATPRCKPTHCPTSSFFGLWRHVAQTTHVDTLGLVMAEGVMCGEGVLAPRRMELTRGRTTGLWWMTAGYSRDLCELSRDANRWPGFAATC